MAKCYFSTKKGCNALKCVRCPENCAFMKTEKEYFAGIQRAKDLLAAKGLEAAVATSYEGKTIMSTRKVESNGR